MAHASAGPDAHRNGRLWAGAELGGEVREIHPGDVIWCPPGEKHWHGATASTAMTHIAIVEKLDGKTVDWMEKVSDEQYQACSCGH
jgi:quercetin dioxygenase-like cupin family protein